MRRIAVFTGTRSEYGLLRPLMARLAQAEWVELQLLVGSGHTSASYGHSVQDILNDGFTPSLCLYSDAVGVNTVADFCETAQQLGDYFRKTTVDLLIVLGDRHETFAAASMATISGVPVAHLHGGDLTQGGLLDDTLRHAISKLAHVHFPATEQSAARLRAMGEDPQHIHVVGAPAVENALTLPLLTREVLAKDLGLEPLRRWLLLTQHPVCAQKPLAEIEPLQVAIERFLSAENTEVIVTGVNQDAGGCVVNAAFSAWADTTPGVHFVQNLGTTRYMSLLSEAWLVAGNSSSALLEAACFAVPALNIGARQKGRERGQNVCDVPADADAIYKELAAFQSDSRYYARYASPVHPFGTGDTSRQILAILEAFCQQFPTQMRQKEWNTSQTLVARH